MMRNEEDLWSEGEESNILGLESPDKAMSISDDEERQSPISDPTSGTIDFFDIDTGLVPEQQDVNFAAMDDDVVETEGYPIRAPGEVASIWEAQIPTFPIPIITTAAFSYVTKNSIRALFIKKGDVEGSQLLESKMSLALCMLSRYIYLIPENRSCVPDSTAVSDPRLKRSPKIDKDNYFAEQSAKRPFTSLGVLIWDPDLSLTRALAVDHDGNVTFQNVYKMNEEILRKIRDPVLSKSVVFLSTTRFADLLETPKAIFEKYARYNVRNYLPTDRGSRGIVSNILTEKSRTEPNISLPNSILGQGLGSRSKTPDVRNLSKTFDFFSTHEEILAFLQNNFYYRPELTRQAWQNNVRSLRDVFNPIDRKCPPERWYHTDPLWFLRVVDIVNNMLNVYYVADGESYEISSGPTADIMLGSDYIPQGQRNIVSIGSEIDLTNESGRDACFKVTGSPVLFEKDVSKTDLTRKPYCQSGVSGNPLPGFGYRADDKATILLRPVNVFGSWFLIWGPVTPDFEQKFQQTLQSLVWHSDLIATGCWAQKTGEKKQPATVLRQILQDYQSNRSFADVPQMKSGTRLQFRELWRLLFGKTGDEFDRWAATRSPNLFKIKVPKQGSAPLVLPRRGSRLPASFSEVRALVDLVWWYFYKKLQEPLPDKFDELDFRIYMEDFFRVFLRLGEPPNYTTFVGEIPNYFNLDFLFLSSPEVREWAKEGALRQNLFLTEPPAGDAGWSLIPGSEEGKLKRDILQQEALAEIIKKKDVLTEKGPDVILLPQEKEVEGGESGTKRLRADEVTEPAEDYLFQLFSDAITYWNLLVDREAKLMFGSNRIEAPWKMVRTSAVDLEPQRASRKAQAALQQQYDLQFRRLVGNRR